MTAISRQNSLFVSENWIRVYEAIANIDFSAYDQKTLRTAILNNIQLVYPDEFNDFIQSSEFIIKLDTLCYLVQSLAYRLDLDTRENFLSAAERKESILNLVFNITYPISRVQAASGEVKIVSIRTNQPLLDLDENSLSNKKINWNDAVDTEWFDKWLIVFNAVFDTRTKWGKPLRRHTEGDTELSLYRLNSPSPATGVYSFANSIGSVSLPFNITNVLLDEYVGDYKELPPNPNNGFHLLYRNDNLGAASTSNGFFLPIKQGKMNHQDFRLDSLQSLQILNINTPNVNNNDVWVCKIDNDGNVLEQWSQTDNILNESLAFNSLNTQKVFEVITRENDQVAVRFGDGKFGEIPQGIFRVWFRTSSPTAYLIKNTDIQRNQLTIPYVSNSQVYNLTVEFSLQESISNASESETIDEIKSKASKVFYTQNRMVNGEDYNNFPLKDNSILKIKAVNRIFAGKSKNLNVKDNTGAYDNITLFADDGRLYKEYKITVTQFTYNSVLQSLDTFIDKNISPMLQTQDKQIFYYNNYKPIEYNQQIIFTTDSTLNNRTRGHLNEDVVSGAVTFFSPDSLLYFADGETARLDYITAGTTGTEPNTVLLKKNITLASEYVSKVFPPLRTNITQSEKNIINERITLKKPFGIRWDFDNQLYTVIKAENLNSGDFDLTFAGDTSATNKDSSWMVKLDYNYSQNGEDFWTISQRGLFYTFESENDINFIHITDRPIVDYKSGRQLRDSIILLSDNESKRSLPRRGVKAFLGNDPYSGKILLVGDGTTDTFEIITDNMSADHVFFEQNDIIVARSDWELKTGSGRYYIKFDTPLGFGELLDVFYDVRKVNMKAARVNSVGDALTDTFSLKQQNIRTENTFCFKETLVQSCFTDYKVYATSVEDRLKFSSIPAVNNTISTFALTGGEPIFNTYSFIGDGIEVDFKLRINTTFVMVFVGGVLVTNYTKDNSVFESDVIHFDSPPVDGQDIHIKALIEDSLATINVVTYTATAGQQTFNNPVTNGAPERCLTFVNGFFQHEAAYDDTLDTIFLSQPVAGGEKVTIYHLTITAGLSTSYDLIARNEFDAKPIFLGQEWEFLIYDQAKFSDAYTNTKAVQITNVDADQSGDIDDPLGFSELIIEDGISDLVLWRNIEENGFDIWDAISENTVPRGTYHSKQHVYVLHQEVSDNIADGSIHYDYPNNVWLIADVVSSGQWIAATNQNAYKSLIGRNNLKFKWNHYTSSDQQINPSSSNVHDIYVLTKEYDRSVRNWIINDSTSDAPTPPSLVALKTQYTYLLDHKTLSDTVIWNPAEYKYLFGPQAPAELQTKFLVVKTLGSNIPDNDLKLKILSVIDSYFNITLWDFGDMFYFTELAAYVHAQLATFVQTFVPVSLNGEPFGRMFEIRCEPNQIFLNTATATQIEIVDSLTDSRLNIKF